jgi:hypothetical protein
MRARVFISCGQNKETDELATAKAIEARLKALGFDPYIAVEEQTLLGLTENIFARLRTSEYFIFVDFKRERLDDGSNKHRGSLFSHQELAIASFLNLDVLAFQEVGVRQLDGIMRFLQANAISFTDRHTLASVVADNVLARGWRSDWRRALEVRRQPGQYKDARIYLESRFDHGREARLFHASVHNCHLTLPAAHTFVYLDHIKKQDGGQLVPLPAVELKWAGYRYPNALIRPSSSRLFDCCWIDHQQPSVANFNVFSDSTEYTPRIEGPGRFRLRYTALADNFPEASLDLDLVLGNSIEDAALTLVPQ